MDQTWSENFIKAICDSLKERRLELGMTLYQVAQSSGISWQSVSAYERYTRRPTLECLARVALALDMTPSQLIAIAEKRSGINLASKKGLAKNKPSKKRTNKRDKA